MKGNEGVARLSIFLFGVGRVRHDATGTDICLSPSVGAVLGYLLLNRHRPHQREALASAFWPEVDGVRARNRLSTALWRLRQILEPAGASSANYLLASRSSSVKFNPESDYWLDVGAFEETVSRLAGRCLGSIEPADVEAFEQINYIYSDDLLQGVDLPWLVIERERLSQCYLAATAKALDWYVQVGRLDEAATSGQRILERDPLREDVHRELIRIYSRAKQRSKAKQQFQMCRSILEEELGVLPLPETIAAAAEAVQPPATSAHQAVDVESAIRMIDAAARTLGLAANELDHIARSLQALGNSR